jgi:hypothetical protein
MFSYRAYIFITWVEYTVRSVVQSTRSGQNCIIISPFRHITAVTAPVAAQLFRFACTGLLLLKAEHSCKENEKMFVNIPEKFQQYREFL